MAGVCVRGARCALARRDGDEKREGKELTGGRTRRRWLRAWGEEEREGAAFKHARVRWRVAGPTSAWPTERGARHGVVRRTACPRASVGYRASRSHAWRCRPLGPIGHAGIIQRCCSCEAGCGELRGLSKCGRASASERVKPIERVRV